MDQNEMLVSTPFLLMVSSDPLFVGQNIHTAVSMDISGPNFVFLILCLNSNFAQNRWDVVCAAQQSKASSVSDFRKIVSYVVATGLSAHA